MEHRHNNRLRWILLAVFILLAGWKLYPTIQLARYTPEELHAMDPKEAVELRSKSIKQGLDLQGGMHMVLEVDLVSLVDNLARNKDSRFETRLRELDAELRKLVANHDRKSLLATFHDAGVPAGAPHGAGRPSRSRA